MKLYLGSSKLVHSSLEVQVDPCENMIWSHQPLTTMFKVQHQLVKVKSQDKKGNLNFPTDYVKVIMPSTIVPSWMKLKESWTIVLCCCSDSLPGTRESCRVQC